MKDSIIIVSGGMDSITMLYEYKDRIALGVSFNYGSNHNAREIPFAELHCKRLGIPHITIDLGFMHQYFKSSLLEGAEAIPEGNYDDENNDEVFIGRDLAHTRNHSEAIAAEIDREVKVIIDDCYQKAKAIILENEAVLHKCAALLLQKERITRDEFEALFV